MSTSEGIARPAAATRPKSGAKAEISTIERPIPSGTNVAGFGSDVVAETLRDLDIPYVALNPGASYRGLHDSLVNHLGNAAPQMLLCLHEEAAVAIAHGYAKVTDKAMAAAVHANVGLLHATMAVFNAWCDRMPMIVLGATGPVDAAKRRPWIDWIHTARRPGRDRAQLHQVGRPARLARGRARSTAARRMARRTPLRAARSTSTSMRTCRRRCSTSRWRRSKPLASCRRSPPAAPPTSIDEAAACSRRRSAR